MTILLGDAGSGVTLCVCEMNDAPIETGGEARRDTRDMKPPGGSEHWQATYLAIPQSSVSAILDRAGAVRALSCERYSVPNMRGAPSRRDRGR